MKTGRDKPIIIMRRKGSTLVPASAFDDEMLCELETGKDVEVTFRQRRSNEQLRLYFAMLKKVNDATDAYPTFYKLHEAIKFDLRFVTRAMSLKGAEFYSVDSVAFEKMDAAAFKVFFDKAVELLASTYGFDPLEFYGRESCQ